MASKAQLLSGASLIDWVDTDNCNFTPGELERARTEILDLEGHIETLEQQLRETAYAPERKRILDDIAELKSRKTELENKYGHCSGWGLI